MDADEARGRLTTLQHRLEKIAYRDPDQEVQGIAVPTFRFRSQAARRVRPTRRIRSGLA